MSKTVFQKIIDSELPAYKVAENEKCLAFLDIHPVALGHCLVIPKLKPTDNIFDLDEDIYLELFKFAKKISSAIQKVTSVKRIGLVIAGFDVPHAHIHLIPSNNISDMSFSNSLKLSPKEMEELARKIRESLEKN